MIVLVWCACLLGVLTVAALIADSWPDPTVRSTRRASAYRAALGRATRTR